MKQRWMKDLCVCSSVLVSVYVWRKEKRVRRTDKSTQTRAKGKLQGKNVTWFIYRLSYDNTMIGKNSTKCLDITTSVADRPRILQKISHKNLQRIRLFSFLQQLKPFS